MNLSDLNELLVCYSMDKNRRHVFFICAESHVKGMKFSFEKSRFFSFRLNIVEIMKDREKCFK